MAWNDPNNDGVVTLQREVGDNIAVLTIFAMQLWWNHCSFHSYIYIRLCQYRFNCNHGNIYNSPVICLLIISWRRWTTNNLCGTSNKCLTDSIWIEAEHLSSTKSSFSTTNFSHKLEVLTEWILRKHTTR